MRTSAMRKTNRLLAFVASLVLLLSLIPAALEGPAAQAAGSELLSMRKPVLASSTEGANAKEGAVDGNISSRWASVWQMDPQWIYVDLGSPANVNRVYLSWEGAYAKSYKVQVSSDAVNWTDIYSTTTGAGGVNDLTGLSGTGRYVRVLCLQRALPDFGYSLYEFQVYGEFTTPQPPAPTNIAINKPATASTWEVPTWSSDPGVVSAVKAVDGDYTSRWSSESWDPQWISVDLGSVHTIGTVILNWESAYGKSYDIQMSNDGTNWTTVYRQLYGQGGVDTIKLKADGRYVRMYGFARGTGFGYSLYEFEIYDFVSGDPIPPVHIPDKPVPQIVSVGAGSYKTNDITAMTPTYPEYKTSNVTGPIPSGGWWQSILIKKLSDGIVALPLRVQYTDQGLSVMNPGSGFVTADGKTASTAGAPDFYLMASNINPLTMLAKVDGYGDYSVRSVLSDDNSFKMKSTIVKGSPYLFNEFTDPASPYLALNGTATRFFDDNNATILGGEGATVTADHIGVEVTNVDSGGNNRVRSYGLFAPAGTVFKRTGGRLTMQLGSGQGYLSIGTLPSTSNLNYYYQHAYAFVTDTRASYTAEDATGLVTTTYNSTVQLKRSGFSSDSLMALLPTQWKTVTGATSLTTLTYPSIRGLMKVHEGDSFFTQNKFTGIIPQFGEPTGSTGYNRADVISYLNSTNTMLENNYMWDDPYWEGKNLQPLAQAVLIADQLGETAIRDKSLTILRNILTNWYRYDGGWPDDYPFYLYYTPEWGAMMGDGGDHGMARWLSDHHYVWGYFIYASAVLASYDKTFLNDYGGMVEHLIRDVGNPSRTDSMYPFMRAFDPYEGVSWAGGYGDSYDGNNQEATSEALFAYAGEYLWGVMTGNAAYRDAGMWVYAVETNSVLQYWFNYDQDNWLPNYQHGVAGQLYGSKNYYGTYFAADANNIYGIQWLPTAPYMTYFGIRPDAAARTYNAFVADKGGAQETGWYHIIWPFQALSNPQGALAKWDPTKIANDDNNGKKEWPNTYWFLHAFDAFGTRTTDIWSSNWTTYQMFKKNNTYTANIWNPTNATQYVVFRDAAGNIVGTVTVPAMKTVVANPVNGVQPPAASGQAAAPVFSLAGGTYNTAQWVSLTSTTAGATIRYTTDGSEPTASSAKYLGPINVTQSMTIKAKAFKELMNASGTSTASYTINVASQVAAPAITPSGGTFTTAQSVTISDATAGATIRYTTDGSTPTVTSGTVYGGAFTVSATSTIKAIAYKSGMTDSAVTTAVITINTGGGGDGTYTALSRTGWTATSNPTSGDVPGNLLDNNMSTRWSSGAAMTNGQYFVVDMKSAQSFNRIVMDSTNAANDYARGYQVYVSNDGTNWGTAVASGTGSSAVITVDFAAQSARYIKVVQTGTASSWWSINEFNVYSNGGGGGGGSDTQAPSTPSGLTATAASSSQINLSWTASTDNVGVTGYDVYRGGTLIGSSATTSYSDTGLTASTSYSYTVKAKDAAGNVSAASAAASATTQAGGGGGGTYTALSRTGWTATSNPTSGDAPANLLDGSMTTRWSTGATMTNGQYFVVDMQSAQSFNRVVMDSTNAANDYARGYQVFVSNDGTNWGSAVATGTGSAAVITVDFAARSARYIKVVQTGTSSSWWSINEFNVYSNGGGGGGGGSDTQAPSAPSGLTATATSSSQINLSWTASTDNVGVTGYDVYRGGTLVGSTASTTYSDTGLAASTAYSYAVKAKDAAGNVSAASAAASATTQAGGGGGTYTALSRTGWTASSNPTSGDVPANLLDGVMTTRWSTGAAMTNGQYLVVDMQAAQSFRRIVMDSTNAAGDYARGYQVYILSDGTNWGSAVATGTGSTPVITVDFATQSARYIKVVQTGSASSWWSINELNVYN